jgi:ATP-dependent DNA ligase
MVTIAPELATAIELTSVQKFINDDRYIMEQKLDGHRVMLVADDVPLFLTRGGMPYTKAVPRGLDAHGLPNGFIVDGELINGVLWAFDVVHVDGQLQKLPLSERRKVLNAVQESSVLRRIPQAVSKDEKERLFKEATDQHYEGVVIKRLDSPYECGIRSPRWLKAKFVVTADVIVLAVGDDGKESCTLGMVDGNTVVEIGRCSLIGKPYVKPGDIIEVAYLYANNCKAPRLYQPRLYRVRDDKTPPECTIDQLKFTNKSVMEALA